MLERFRKLQLTRVMSVFRVWNTKSVLIGAAGQFRGQMETLVKSTLEEAQRSKEIALETLRVESQEVLALQEDRLRQEFDEALNRARESEAAEREVLASKREALYHTTLQQDEARWKEQMALIKESNAQALAEVQDQRRVDLATMTKNHEEEVERSIREGLLRAEQAKKDTEETVNAHWAAKMAVKTEEFNEAMRKALITADVDKDQAMITELRRVNEETAARMTKQRLEVVAEKESALSAMMSLHALEIEKINASFAIEKTKLESSIRLQLVDQAAASLKQEREQTEQRICDLSAGWETELAGQMSRKDEEHANILNEKLEQQASILETEKARALKLEASKWKQALKEAEKRLELEKKQANERGREEGREEKEAEIRLEMATYDEKKQQETQAALTEKLKAAMDEMQRDHAEKMAIQEAKLRAQQEEAAIAAEKVVDMQVAFERAKTDALIEAESTLRGRLALEWTERLQQEVATALEQAAAAHRQEIAKHEELNRDYERALVAKMERLVLTTEAERTRILHERAQKWRQGMADAEKRHASELEQARLSGQFYITFINITNNLVVLNHCPPTFFKA